jgi:hypothetical protein
MKYDINNDLSRLNEWARLWLVDFNTKKTPKPPSHTPQTYSNVGLMKVR